jgi:hypothetical protein
MKSGTYALEKEDFVALLHEIIKLFYLFFFFLVAPTLGSLLPLWSIGLSFLSLLIRDSH